MCKFPVGFGFGIFLSCGGFPFERHSALWVRPLGNARRAVGLGEKCKSSLLHSVCIPVFTVVEVGNQTRSIRSYLDFVDRFTYGLPPVFRIPDFLSGDRYTCAMVLKFPSFDLRLCTVQVLGCRVPPILDPATTPKFPVGRTGPRVIVVSLDSIAPLIRQSPILQGSTTGPPSFRVSIPRTPRHPRLRLHVHPPVRITHADNPSVRRITTVYLLVGGTATG